MLASDDEEDQPIVIHFSLCVSSYSCEN
jgi:hypothetical protein